MVAEDCLTRKIVGIIEVSVQQDKVPLGTPCGHPSSIAPLPRMCYAHITIRNRQEVLYHLPKGTDSYAYVGSMTVDEQYRRRGVALAMLAQAEQIARASLPSRPKMCLCTTMHEHRAEPSGV